MSKGKEDEWVVLVFREKHLAAALACVVLVLTLGNAFTSVYVVVALFRSRGSWARFWLDRERLANALRCEQSTC